MGKKDGKRVDKAKAEAKKARQASKQTKIDKKNLKKDIMTISGTKQVQDIESILAEFASKEKVRTNVSVTVCAQPSPSKCDIHM